jgi:tetratricopeptide (TPR) repeat protein
MNSSFVRKSLRFILIVLTAIISSISICRAQMGGNPPQMMQQNNTMQERMELSNKDALGDKDEIAAYQAFTKQQDAAKKIQLGNDFLQKYPKGSLAEHVDSGLMNVYRSQQDYKDAYLYADNALAMQPDDVDVLATVGWTIPHVYSPSDPDAVQELNKAETYAKHAIEVLDKMAKPTDLNDSQFAAAKAKRYVQAHSALGLVYFRREDYENSAKELALATKGAPTPDQTDLFVLGIDLQNLNRNGEATDAFRACSQIAGPLQNQCKQNADSTKK